MRLRRITIDASRPLIAAVTGATFLVSSSGGQAIAIPLAGGGTPFPAATPELETDGATLYPDQGRLELRGTHLNGARVVWKGLAAADERRCLEPRSIARAEQCFVSVPRDLPIGTVFTLLPPSVPGAATDRSPPLLGIVFRPARTVVDRVIQADAVVDLTGGAGRVPLVHPEAVAAVDCAPARCELGEAGISVRAVGSASTTVVLKLRLAPGYMATRGDGLEAVVTRSLTIAHCSADVVSGPPLRTPAAGRVIVKLDPRCGRDARALRWTVNGAAAEVQRLEPIDGAVYVQLGTRGLEGSEATVLAARPEPDDTVVAIARIDLRAPPLVKATLELPTIGPVGFLPTNRDAVVRAAPAGDGARLVPLPIEGAYQVKRGMEGEAETWRVRGEDSAGGFVELRFGYRMPSLPPPFSATDLWVLTEPLQRPIRQANVPAPLGASALGTDPLIELVCADARGLAHRITPGARANVPFAQRDSCRLVIHREHFAPEDGTQDLTVEVNITKLDDSARAESHFSERMLLRPGREPRVFWVRGVKARFDRVSVHVAHVEDETADAGADGGAAGARPKVPAAQWSLIFGEGRIRFYAAAAIPTGLFRITAPSDVLTLNFGALARVTWLSPEGREGLVGLELGALGIGLAATQGFPRTLAALGGIGVAIPIGNRGEPSQASVNLHAWLAYELRDEYHLVAGDPSSPLARHVSFLFGPSITIGNVGTNL